MTLYEWLLFLHVLAAFALVSGLAAYGVLVLGGGDPVRRALGPPAVALWNLGGIGVLILGIWLAIDVDGYAPWDGWVLGAIVLWLVAFGASGPLGSDLRESAARLSAERARLLLGVMTIATAALLLDMIFKPGA